MKLKQTLKTTLIILSIITIIIIAGMLETGRIEQLGL